MIGKRGPKPKGKVKIKWSSNFAYAIGLIVSDGSLSKNGRHICFVSKDIEQLENFMKALEIKVFVGSSISGFKRTKTPRIQFGDVLFYNFLLDIGLMPNKSNVLKEVIMPPEFFFDFLRGSFDGDGCTYSYFDPRWKSSFMFYKTFVSSSKEHVLWLQEEIFIRLAIKGHITGGAKRNFYQLKYAKVDSLLVLRAMYPTKNTLCLSRKRLKIEAMLRTIGQRL